MGTYRSFAAVVVLGSFGVACSSGSSEKGAEKDSKSESTSESASSSKAKKSDEKKAASSGEPDASATKPAGSAEAAAKPAESASGAPPGCPNPPSAFGGKQIDAGNVASGAWVDTFRYERTVSPDATKLIPAAEACKAKGYALCTSDQFERACAADAAVGASPAWTASFDPSGKFIVRGPGCASAEPTDVAATIAGAGLSCCSRAISIDSSNKNVAFMRSAGAQIVALETATQKGDEAALGRMLAPEVDFYSSKLAGAAVADKIASVSKGDGALWLLHQHCSLDLDPQRDTWWATCDKATYQNGKLSAGSTKYDFQGAAHVIDSISQGKMAREPAAP